jgi:predicted DsbA family dithiol-disulfide isomerase
MLVEIWSDVVCPWCYVGKRRFERALAQFAHRDDVQLVWRAFELDPAAPPSAAEAGDYAERLARKYRTDVAGAQRMIDTMTATAAGEGLDFRFDRMRPGNTFDAHRLLHLARERGIQDDVKEALDRATFTQGLAVSDHDSLVAVVTAAGLDPDQARAVLASDRYADAVRGDQAQANAYGITGVPFFVVDSRYGVSGAQSPELIREALETAWRSREPRRLQTVGGEAPECTDDSCAV